MLCNLSNPSKCTLSRCLVIVSRFRGLATVWLDLEYLLYLMSQSMKMFEDKKKDFSFKKVQNTLICLWIRNISVNLSWFRSKAYTIFSIVRWGGKHKISFLA